MMSVLQYADDINRTVDEVLKKCQVKGLLYLIVKIY